jgi:hypothetical protein
MQPAIGLMPWSMALHSKCTRVVSGMGSATSGAVKPARTAPIHEMQINDEYNIVVQSSSSSSSSSSSTSSSMYQPSCDMLVGTKVVSPDNDAQLFNAHPWAIVNEQWQTSTLLLLLLLLLLLRC